MIQVRKPPGGWPQEGSTTDLQGDPEDLDPARRPFRPPREEEREVDAVIFQPRREVQGVRLVEAVAVQQHGAVEAVGDRHVGRRFVLQNGTDGIQVPIRLFKHPVGGRFLVPDPQTAT